MGLYSPVNTMIDTTTILILCVVAAAVVLYAMIAMYAVERYLENDTDKLDEQERQYVQGYIKKYTGEDDG